MVWIALALWLVLAGAAFLVVVGPGGGMGPQQHTEGGPVDKLRLLVLGLAAAMTIAVPIIIGINTGQRSRKGPDGIKLTANEAMGRELFARVCANCHTLAAAAAVGHVGPNLDVVKPPAALVQVAIQYGFSESTGQMPAGIYTGQQATDVADFVAAVAGQG